MVLMEWRSQPTSAMRSSAAVSSTKILQYKRDQYPCAASEYGPWPNVEGPGGGVTSTLAVPAASHAGGRAPWGGAGGALPGIRCAAHAARAPAMRSSSRLME